MKVQSPTHIMIQLRRRTEKIVTPKLYCDLSNKQNNNTFNFFSKNKDGSSSKKSSLQKKNTMKKTLNIPQNTPKCAIKKVGLEGYKHRATKQKSDNNIYIKKSSKSFSTELRTNQFVQKMDRILKRVQRKEKFEIQAQYNEVFARLPQKNEVQACNFYAVKQHLQYWVAKYEALQFMLNTISQTPSVAEKNIEALFIESQEISESQSSEYSYLVDPNEKIKISKPLRKELRQQLHLNFERISSLKNCDKL